MEYTWTLLLIIMLSFVSRGAVSLRMGSRSCGNRGSLALFNSRSGGGMVSIPASEVAAAVGRNPYKPASEVFNQLWNRWSPETFTGTTKIDEMLEAVQRLSVEQQAMIEKVASYKAKNANDAVSKLGNATSIIASFSQHF